MTKVLVIEDNEAVREGIVEVLELVNINVLEAKNGFIGVHLAKEQLPDLIICDVIMPGINGYEVCSILRQDFATAKIPFVFLTVRTQQEDVQRGIELGANYYLGKPFTIEGLVKAIRTQLEQHAAVA